MFSRANGRPLKYYIQTLDGYKFSATPGTDPVYGVPYRPITQEMARTYIVWRARGGQMQDPSVVMRPNRKHRSTHVSIQSSDLEKARELIATYRKPVIYDECKYEGNIPRRWGNISAQEMVRRFWLGTVSGAYVGHGETYLDPNAPYGGQRAEFCTVRVPGGSHFCATFWRARRGKV